MPIRHTRSITARSALAVGALAGALALTPLAATAVQAAPVVQSAAAYVFHPKGADVCVPKNDPGKYFFCHDIHH
ncbi:hypothetical protein [Clavibacter michiganensis]|uniref:hypothetical protein n=1 Tax=Clavibacter michiganensis TaxID=28447 RepID=UPI0026DD3394|nr:hypothetical protein [Clavibacter michiganensis]MDO4066728.1 hypothetical protein [Clavibacter michiganensis]MDO4072728.1 hypothetical protein [Clavibacter michiganensis]MDO4091169.1 hypothetical protein [Clavibacter michiganensis]